MRRAVGVTRDLSCRVLHSLFELKKLLIDHLESGERLVIVRSWLRRCFVARHWSILYGFFSGQWRLSRARYNLRRLLGHLALLISVDDFLREAYSMLRINGIVDIVLTTRRTFLLNLKEPSHQLLQFCYFVVEVLGRSLEVVVQYDSVLQLLLLS